MLILASSFVVNAAPQFSSGRGRGSCYIVDSENNPIGTIFFNFRISEKYHLKRGPMYGFIELEIDEDNDGSIDIIISLNDISTIIFDYDLFEDWGNGFQCLVGGIASINYVNSKSIDNKLISVKLHDKDASEDVDHIGLLVDSELYNIGDLISGNIMIKIAVSSGHR